MKGAAVAFSLPGLSTAAGSCCWGDGAPEVGTKAGASTRGRSPCVTLPRPFTALPWPGEGCRGGGGKSAGSELSRATWSATQTRVTEAPLPLMQSVMIKSRPPLGGSHSSSLSGLLQQHICRQVHQSM